MRLTVLLGALLCVLTIHAADARPRHTSPQQVEVGCADPIMRPCVGVASIVSRSSARRGRLQVRRQKLQVRAGTLPVGLQRVMAEGAGRVVAHPPGCPVRAFCGCGASVERFGRSIRSLWLAANWLKFPRAAPAPGRAAVRPDGHHIVILRRQISGSTWLVYDANSGGRHRTRIHPRSIAGWTIVDPRGDA